MRGGARIGVYQPKSRWSCDWLNLEDRAEGEGTSVRGRYLLELRTVPTNSKVFLRGLLNMREMQILTSVIEIQKENWG